ncbi:type IV pilin N-terminal domain-containing protein [Methanoregula sp.]|uniref:type IV pilin N-terminal domain-containing protein n=1 Tax=Methanoregula sp. TaxID=2052170 RepID=UPI00236A6056|nr:type IV pilin N-terminal domain-containing protein [Methanoregula sp.]MDD1686698.1 type IV pilin N-terminal domain-containing protein [Methanoregula sp.]
MSEIIEKQNRAQTECAVSPVVGVMLMLVVVIIIAAVVSAFAGGLGDTSKKAPTVSMDVTIDLSADNGMGSNVPMINFKHLSGDPLPTKDLQIITYFTNKSGYTYKHTQSKLSNVSLLYWGSKSDVRVPYLGDMTTGYASSSPETKDFGNFTIKTGDVMTTYNLRGTAELLGMNWTAGATKTDPDTFDDPSLKSGSVVEVKILHVPSGKYLLDKEVVVR